MYSNGAVNTTEGEARMSVSIHHHLLLVMVVLVSQRRLRICVLQGAHWTVTKTDPGPPKTFRVRNLVCGVLPLLLVLRDQVLS